MTEPAAHRLSNRTLVRGLAAFGLAVIGVLCLLPFLPADVRRPGSPLLQSCAALGALLLLAPLVFSVRKRNGRAQAPILGYVVHVGAGVLGSWLVLVHALSAPGGPPLILVGLLLILIATGAGARLWLAADMASTFGRKPAAFAAPDPARKDVLRGLIDAKRAVLARLDGSAQEATFSPDLRHWMRAPAATWSYQKLARAEARVIGTRRSVSAWQAWWRPIHLAAAVIFWAGLFLHVVIVTFFARYAAGTDAIYWWHLAAWDLPL